MATPSSALAIAAVLVPGGAYAASQLVTNDDVAASLPAGGEIAPGRFKGTFEPTVGADQRVNGGCRAEDPDGRRWRCYLGREAVRQQIIGPDFLGRPSAGPGVGQRRGQASGSRDRGRAVA